MVCPNCHALTDNYTGKNVDRENIAIKREKRDRKHKIGVSDDGQRLYDEFGNFKILCPICCKRFMGKNSKMCYECRNESRSKHKIDKEELFEIMKTNTYSSAAKLLGVDRKTVAKWHRFYVDENNKHNEDQKLISSENAPSRDVLKFKIRTMSFVQVGKQYNVTDNSVRKWCDTYKLPRHKREIKSYSDEEWELI